MQNQRTNFNEASSSYYIICARTLRLQPYNGAGRNARLWCARERHPMGILASQREGGFVPECVEVYGDKAYIRGWLDTNGTNEPYRVAPYDDGLLPAEIVCDLANGQVTHAAFYCEILDKE